MFWWGLLVILIIIIMGCDHQPTEPEGPYLVLDSPSEGDTLGHIVTFRWHMENPLPWDIYHYRIIFDDGVFACDGNFGGAIDAGTRNCLTVRLPAEPGQTLCAIEATSGTRWYCGGEILLRWKPNFSLPSDTCPSTSVVSVNLPED